MVELFQFELGQVCSRLSSGKGIPAKEVHEIGAYPVYGGNGLRGYTDQSNFEGECAIIGRQGAFCGNVRYFSGAAYMTEHAVVLCANEKNDTRYLAYLLSIMNLGRLSGQSAQPGLSVKSLAKQIVSLPSLSEQKVVADTLSALDEKIENNSKINHHLEQMAQAVFRHWFVVDGEAEGWNLVPLPEIVEVNPSRTLKRGEVAPYLDMANMPTKGHRGIDWVDRAFGSGTKFTNGDTLMARITPCLENGKTAFVDFLDDNQVGWGSTEYIVFRPKPPLPPEYGYLLARGNELRNHAIVNMTGTSGRQRTPASCFDNFLVSVPPDKLAKNFGEFVRPLFATIKANDTESRSLANMRDSLLPKLMSGELSVLKLDAK